MPASRAGHRHCGPRLTAGGMAARQTCDRGQVASTLRYCMTVGGTVVLVVGTLCFAWWSEGDAAARPGQLALAGEHHDSSAPGPVLRSVSFLCCGIGGLLLVFGLLWSIHVSTWGPRPGDLYRLSRDLYYLTEESSEKESCRPSEAPAITTYQEAMHCLLAEGPPALSVQPEEEDLSCGSPGDALGKRPPSPPPSYESVLCMADVTSPPGAVSSCAGWVQTSGELQSPSMP